MTVPPFEAFYLSGPADSGGQRFCIYHAAHGADLKGLVLYVQPFAEEMNKSRRMAAIQARALAAAGFGVLQMDLLGCGDSSGDFSDATWQHWVQDLLHAAQWLQNKGDAPLWFWGLRGGCLLAVAAAMQLKQPSQFVFWQATPSGKTHSQQFLRLKMASELQGGQAKAVMEALRASLDAGQSVEVAGYGISAPLAKGLETAKLFMPEQSRRLIWLEVSNREDAALMPASETVLGEWATAGCEVHSEIVRGPAFWQTTEIEDAPRLIDATLAAMLQTHGASAALVP